MGSLTIRNNGFDVLDRKLEAIMEGVSKQDAAEGLDAGAKIIEDEEHRRVPKRTGNLNRSIVRTMEPTNLPADGLTVYIGPRTGSGGPDGWYGVFSEFGWGGRAQPWVRPSVDTKSEEAFQAVASRLQRSVLDLAA